MTTMHDYGPFGDAILAAARIIEQNLNMRRLLAASVAAYRELAALPDSPPSTVEFFTKVADEMQIVCKSIGVDLSGDMAEAMSVSEEEVQ